MSRYFALQTWVGSHENEPDYDGNMCGSRNVRSVEAIPLYDIYGKANVNAFSESAIAARMGKTPTKVPLKNRILPQAARLDKLQAEIVELENAYRSGEFSPKEYTLLREVAFAKKARAETLYKKAISVKAPSYDEYEDSYNREEMPEDEAEYTYESCEVDYTDTPIAGSSYPSWIDELSPMNSLKKPLKIACTLARKALHLSQAARNYYLTLKAL